MAIAIILVALASAVAATEVGLTPNDWLEANKYQNETTEGTNTITTVVEIISHDVRLSKSVHYIVSCEGPCKDYKATLSSTKNDFKLFVWYWSNSTEKGICDERAGSILECPVKDTPGSSTVETKISFDSNPAGAKLTMTGANIKDVRQVSTSKLIELTEASSSNRWDFLVKCDSNCRDIQVALSKSNSESTKLTAFVRNAETKCDLTEKSDKLECQKFNLKDRYFNVGIEPLNYQGPMNLAVTGNIDSVLQLTDRDPHKHDSPCGNSTNATEWSCASDAIGTGCCLQMINTTAKDIEHFFKVECSGPCTDIGVRVKAESGDVDLSANEDTNGCCGLCDQAHDKSEQLTEECPTINLSSNKFYVRVVTHYSVEDIKLTITSAEGNLMGVTRLC